MGSTREDDSGFWLVARWMVADSPMDRRREAGLVETERGQFGQIEVEALRGCQGESSKWFEAQV